MRNGRRNELTIVRSQLRVLREALEFPEKRHEKYRELSIHPNPDTGGIQHSNAIYGR